VTIATFSFSSPLIRALLIPQRRQIGAADPGSHATRLGLEGHVFNYVGVFRHGAHPESGNVEIDVTRDRESTFEPQIVKKRQRRLGGVDEIVLSLCAKGLTTGEISRSSICG
jgi:hypothetical protein